MEHNEDMIYFEKEFPSGTHCIGGCVGDILGFPGTWILHTEKTHTDFVTAVARTEKCNWE